MTPTKNPTKESQKENINRKIETVSGKLVDPTNPDPDDINLHDIAWSLSRSPRFAGHTISPIPYNVAQHSVHVFSLVQILFDSHNMENHYIDDNIYQAIKNSISNKNEIFIKALLHDAHEAYTNDIPSPLKNLPSIKHIFEDIETKLDNAIYIKFGLSSLKDDERKVIKFCDKIAQSIEADAFMISRGKHWNLPKFDISLFQTLKTPEKATDSYNSFIQTYTSLLAMH